MIFHPLQENLSNLDDDDLERRIKDLTSKYFAAQNVSRDPALSSQITSALDLYNAELARRRSAPQTAKTNPNDPDLDDLINVNQ